MLSTNVQKIPVCPFEVTILAILINFIFVFCRKTHPNTTNIKWIKHKCIYIYLACNLNLCCSTEQYNSSRQKDEGCSTDVRSYSNDDSDINNTSCMWVQSYPEYTQNNQIGCHVKLFKLQFLSYTWTEQKLRCSGLSCN